MSLIRSRQDSNLCSQRESDFESDALTTRPRLPMQLAAWKINLWPLPTKCEIANIVTILVYVWCSDLKESIPSTLAGLEPAIPRSEVWCLIH